MGPESSVYKPDDLRWNRLHIEKNAKCILRRSPHSCIDPIQNQSAAHPLHFALFPHCTCTNLDIAPALQAPSSPKRAILQNIACPFNSHPIGNTSAAKFVSLPWPEGLHRDLPQVNGLDKLSLHMLFRYHAIFLQLLRTISVRTCAARHHSLVLSQYSRGMNHFAWLLEILGPLFPIFLVAPVIKDSLPAGPYAPIADSLLRNNCAMSGLHRRPQIADVRSSCVMKWDGLRFKQWPIHPVYITLQADPDSPERCTTSRALLSTPYHSPNWKAI